MRNLLIPFKGGDRGMSFPNLLQRLRSNTYGYQETSFSNSKIAIEKESAEILLCRGIGGGPKRSIGRVGGIALA